MALNDLDQPVLVREQGSRKAGIRMIEDPIRALSSDVRSLLRRTLDGWFLPMLSFAHAHCVVSLALDACA
jgi:hypothetical protein